MGEVSGGIIKKSDTDFFYVMNYYLLDDIYSIRITFLSKRKGNSCRTCVWRLCHHVF